MNENSTIYCIKCHISEGGISFCRTNGDFLQNPWYSIGLNLLYYSVSLTFCALNTVSRLCWHNFERNRLAKALSNMPA